MEQIVLAVTSGDLWAIATIIALLVGVVATVSKSYGYGTISFVIAAILVMFSTISPYGWMWDNKLAILTYTLIYFAIGVVWSLVAWALLMTQKARTYNAERERYLPRFMEERQITKLTEQYYSEFRDYLYQNSQDVRRLDLKHDDLSLATEIALWPFKLIYFICGRFIAEVVRAIYNRMGNIYGRIRMWAFRKFPEFQ